jgi:hypothetical protein
MHEIVSLGENVNLVQIRDRRKALPPLPAEGVVSSPKSTSSSLER